LREADYVCDLGDGLLIRSVSPYAGPFWEDGSGREVRNVWQLTVTNTSEENIQLLRIHAEAEGQEAEFEITTLLAGSTVKVLEKSASEFPEDEEEGRYEVEDLAYLKDEISIYPEQFTLSAKDGWIRLENKGEQDITQDIYVYYKAYADDVFTGGITYRVKFEGGIPSGESREETAGHYLLDGSKILYLTYRP